eukprot:scaffold1465_cov179-Amphora_coffeaeformis.AAC.7
MVVCTFLPREGITIITVIVENSFNLGRSIYFPRSKTTWWLAVVVYAKEIDWALRMWAVMLGRRSSISVSYILEAESICFETVARKAPSMYYYIIGRLEHSVRYCILVTNMASS